MKQNVGSLLRFHRELDEVFPCFFAEFVQFVAKVVQLRDSLR